MCRAEFSWNWPTALKELDLALFLGTLALRRLGEERQCWGGGRDRRTAAVAKMTRFRPPGGRHSPMQLHNALGATGFFLLWRGFAGEVGGSSCSRVVRALQRCLSLLASSLRKGCGSCCPCHFCVGLVDPGVDGSRERNTRTSEKSKIISTFPDGGHRHATKKKCVPHGQPRTLWDALLGLYVAEP